MVFIRLDCQKFDYVQVDNDTVSLFASHWTRLDLWRPVAGRAFITLSTASGTDRWQ